MFAVVLSLIGLFPAAMEQAVNATCNADLVCVRTYKGQNVRLELESYTAKPLTVQLFFTTENMHHLGSPVVRLSGPSVHQLVTFERPVGAWGYEYRTHYGHEQYTHDDGYVYTLPYDRGQAFTVAQSHTNMSTHRLGNRYAIDWAMPVGTRIFAARGGRVVSVYAESNDQTTGNHIWVQHADGTIGKYLHLQHKGVRVQQGDVIEPGDFIGKSGNTGFSQGPHLHFSVSSLGGRWPYQTFNVTFATHKGRRQLIGNTSYTRP